MTFEELGLSPAVLQAVSDAGYTTPTPIQAQAIPHVLTGRDVLGCAQTGTGKTAGFTLPMIDILSAGRAKARMPRSLILEPTRELAAQVGENFEIYGKHTKLSMALLIGGVSFGDQEKKLDRGVDVLIATPGRLLDHIERGKVLLSDVKVLVIDEADRMLDMGFIPDIERIVGMLPKLRQTLFFSATMPPEIRKLADKFLMNPREVSVSPPATVASTVRQGLAIVPAEDKREALRRLINSEDVQNAIIFCNRKRDVDVLFKSLQKHGFDVGALHGDMVQSVRTETLERFKNREIRLLVASDVAARGLDVDNLSHVFNFDVPTHPEDYVHRIGRTGRAGKSGASFTLAAPDEERLVTAIEQLSGKTIERIAIDELTCDFSAEDEGGRRGRGRGRGRGAARGPARTGERRAKEAPAREQAARPRRAETPEAEAAPAPADNVVPMTRERAGKPREERRRDEPRRDELRRDEHRRDEHRRDEHRRDEHRRDDRDERRRERNRERDLGPPVVGMGDHMPAFLMRPARGR
ncbi:MAG: DEAD/DEAH box helicase [Reyranellaceae bacterium]